MAKLRTYVHVDGEVYGPDDDLPAEVAAKITNPKVWADESDEDSRADTAAGKAGTSTGARLAGYVQVAGGMYGPDDEVPADVAAQITNPKAWEGGKLPDLPAAEQAPEETDSSDAVNPPAEPSKDKAPADTTSPPTGQADVPAPPPRSGRGSGVDAWTAWATARGVAVAAGANREDIIAACEDAKVLEPAAQ